MLRDGVLRPRWLVHLVIAWGIALAALPSPGEGAPLPPARDGATVDDLSSLRARLESKLIRERLLALGVSPADAALAIERLSPAERSEMAARVDELAAGGTGVEIIAIVIIAALLVILVLELLGRRVISKPS